MTQQSRIGGGSTQWHEVNWLRGLAAVMMIVNHAGYAWLDPARIETPIIGGVIFVGGFAPILFFFLTGVGYGIQAASGVGRHVHRYGFLRKVAILFVADAMLWIPRGYWVGMDFLGFIALSMLCLQMIRNSKHPLRWAIVVILVCGGVRYGVGPVLGDGMARDGWGAWVRFALGTETIDGFSYYVCPWLVFPMAGFLSGYTAQRFGFVSTKASALVIWALLAIGGGLAVLTWLLMDEAHTLGRWGSMSSRYFLASAACLSLSSGLALAIFRSQGIGRWARRMSLRGVQSLAVVPVHYLLILGVGLLTDASTGTGPLLAWALMTIYLSFVGANTVRALSEADRITSHADSLYLLVTAAVVGVLVFAVLAGKELPTLKLACGVSVQIVLCMLLAVRPTKISARPPAATK